MRIFFLILFIAFGTAAAEEKETKGLLPEIKLNDNDEDRNQQKSFQSEVLITKSENQAIETLQKIIKKRRGQSDEPDLLFRLAELYMRRARSGRYFDLDRLSENKLKQVGLSAQKAQTALRQALGIYDQIQARFPHFASLDFVLFNSAMATHQLKDTEKAKKIYRQLISRYPNSKLLPDALLELGEILYNQQGFSAALETFTAVEKFPDSNAYPYAIYKSAWCHYNLKNTSEGINRLLLVVKQNPYGSNDSRKYNLRKEALRDLTLFVGESLAAEKIFGFFRDITAREELGEIMLQLADLYESHSRYREISIFTEKFISAYPESAEAPKCFTRLIEADETLKLRPQVIKNLGEMADFCRERKNDAACLTEFRRVSVDIAKKWWEIWLKNKSNSEFSSLTEKAFENLLRLDTPEAPDSKSRFFYAELLFQQGKFAPAAQNYEQVSVQKNLTEDLQHDSLYGALFSIEKDLEKKETDTLLAKQQQLAKEYLKVFPNGEHATEIQYKLGYIAYRNKDYPTALSYTTPLLKKSVAVVLRKKAEDLVLDIYNLQKEFSLLERTANQISGGDADASRKAEMKKLSEQAAFSRTQNEIEKAELKTKISALQKFIQSHPESPLARDAGWQALSLAFSAGSDVLGADLSHEYFKKYPADSRALDSLKEALKAYLDAGQLTSAVQTLKTLAENDKSQSLKHREMICDLLRLDSGTKPAKDCYSTLLQLLPAKKRELAIKLYELAPGPETERQMLELDIEPFATKILVKKAQNLLEQNKIPEAFSLSLKINARPVDADLRAEARLIQAAILEKEFVQQSVKAPEDRMTLVMSMKTEKLDKAFTAYSSAVKMSKTPEVQLKALQGIDRLYSHFISVIGTTPLKELAPAFAEKKAANEQQIRKLDMPLATTGVDWASLSVESSVPPQITYPPAEKFRQYYPDGYRSLPSEKEALALAAEKKTRVNGLYLLSLIAESHGETDKALWLLDKAEALEKNNGLVDYQKGKLLFSVKDLNTAMKYFAKLFDNKTAPSEVRVLSALKHFSEGDYKKARDEFSGLSTEQIYNYGMEILQIDSIFRLGDTEGALALSRRYSSRTKDQVAMSLELGRIYEAVPGKRSDALTQYQQALAKASEDSQQKWLRKKIEFLKNEKNKQIISYVGGN